MTASYAEWLGAIRDEIVASGMIVDGKLVSGVAAARRAKKKKPAAKKKSKRR